MLDLTGLAGAAHRRVGGYSLGMRQRLALAAALLGDPQILVLDEPAGGLDPEGVHWLRGLSQTSARDGHPGASTTGMIGLSPLAEPRRCG